MKGNPTWTPNYQLPKELNPDGVQNLMEGVLGLAGKDYRAAKRYILNHHKGVMISKAKIEDLQKALEETEDKSVIYQVTRNLEKEKQRFSRLMQPHYTCEECERLLGSQIARKLDYRICEVRYQEWEDSFGNIVGGVKECIGCEVPEYICKARRTAKIEVYVKTKENHNNTDLNA